MDICGEYREPTVQLSYVCILAEGTWNLQHKSKAK